MLGTVRGDLHDIGKNLVGMMAEGTGLQVVDIGVDASPEKFIEAAQNNNAHLIAMSALLTTTMVNMKEVRRPDSSPSGSQPNQDHDWRRSGHSTIRG